MSDHNPSKGCASSNHNWAAFFSHSRPAPSWWCGRDPTVTLPKARVTLNNKSSEQPLCLQVRCTPVHCTPGTPSTANSRLHCDTLRHKPARSRRTLHVAQLQWDQWQPVLQRTALDAGALRASATHCAATARASKGPHNNTLHCALARNTHVHKCSTVTTAVWWHRYWLPEPAVAAKPGLETNVFDQDSLECSTLQRPPAWDPAPPHHTMLPSLAAQDAL